MDLYGNHHLITIVRWTYKPTYNVWVPHIVGKMRGKRSPKWDEKWEWYPAFRSLDRPWWFSSEIQSANIESEWEISAGLWYSELFKNGGYTPKLPLKIYHGLVEYPTCSVGSYYYLKVWLLLEFWDRSRQVSVKIDTSNICILLHLEIPKTSQNTLASPSSSEPTTFFWKDNGNPSQDLIDRVLCCETHAHVAMSAYPSNRSVFMG